MLNVDGLPHLACPFSAWKLARGMLRRVVYGIDDDFFDAAFQSGILTLHISDGGKCLDERRKCLLPYHPGWPIAGCLMLREGPPKSSRIAGSPRDAIIVRINRTGQLEEALLEARKGLLKMLFDGLVRRQLMSPWSWPHRTHASAIRGRRPRALSGTGSTPVIRVRAYPQ